MCEEEKERGVQKLVKLFESRFAFTHSHSADEGYSTTGAPSSARMRRRSFAKKQQPAFRTTGSASSVSSGSSTDTYSPALVKTFNRKAALRRPMTSDNKRRTDSKVQFSFENNQSPGGFSPRTSLRRQKSISADSLAEIRTTAENIHCEEHGDLPAGEYTENKISDCESTNGHNISDVLTNRSHEKGSPELLLRRLLKRSVHKEKQDSPVHTTLDRTVSDTSGLTRKTKDRFVTFSTDVTEAETIRKLTRTPTPYWSQDSEEAEYVFDEQSDSASGL